MTIPYYLPAGTSNTLIIFDFIPWTAYSGNVSPDQFRGFQMMIDRYLGADCMFIFEQGGKYSDLTEEDKNGILSIAATYDSILLSGPICTKIILSEEKKSRTKAGELKITRKPVIGSMKDGIFNVYFVTYRDKTMRVSVTQYPKYWGAYITENFFNILKSDVELLKFGGTEYIEGKEPWTEVHTLEELKNFLNVDAYIESAPFSFDIETTGIRPQTTYFLDDEYEPGYTRPHQIMSCSVCINPRQGGASFLIDHPRLEGDVAEGWAMLKWLMGLPNPKVAHNAKFEYTWVEKFSGIPIEGQLRDTQLLSHLINENMGKATQRYTLAGSIALYTKNIPHKGDFLGKISRAPKKLDRPYLKRILTALSAGKKSTEEDILTLKAFAEDPKRFEIREKDFSRFSREELHQYGCYDSQSTLEVYLEQERLLRQIDEERSALRGYPVDSVTILFQLQNRMIRTLGTMEYNGMPCDTDAILKIIHGCQREQEQAEEYLNTHLKNLPENFNWGSTKDISGYLRKYYPKLKDVMEETSKGDLKLDKAALEGIKAAHPWVGELLRYRHAQKARTTYMAAFYKFSINRRLHFSFNLDGTATGRLSSDRPNMQNIPKKIAGTPIKSVLLPEKGCALYNLDLATAEVRMLANYSKDKDLIKALSSGGLDLHSFTASRISDFSYEEIIGARKREKIPGVVLTEREKAGLRWRQSAKTVTFGTIYGMTAKGLAGDLGVEESEAQGIIEGFYKAYSGVANWIRETESSARSYGYVETIFGRRRNFKLMPRLPEYMPKSGKFMQLRMLRQAVNYMIQGTTSDFFQMLLYDLLKIPGITLHITVHDSVVFSLDETKTSVQELYQICDEIFIQKPKRIFGDFLQVPMNYDLGRGFTYGEVTDLDREKIFSGEIVIDPNKPMRLRDEKVVVEKKEKNPTPKPKRKKLIRRRSA